MPGRWTLTAKLYVSGITFLLLAIASIGLTLWVTWNLEGGAAAVNEAGRMRMQTYRLTIELSKPSGTADTKAMARAFDDSLALLRSGDPSRPLFVPWSQSSRGRFDLVTQRWGVLRERWLNTQPTAAEATRDADAFVALVDELVAAIEGQIARWTAILHLFQLSMLALAIAGAVAMLYAGYLFVLNPLARLKRGVVSMQQGDLSTRVTVESNDEFGQLSAGFNDMAQTLQSLYGSLEDKVREKWGVSAGRIGDVLAIIGDTVDNIPGIAGLGPKTAATLINEHGSLHALLANLGAVKSERTRTKLIEGTARVRENREMVRLDEDLPLPTALAELQITPRWTEFVAALEKCDFKGLLAEVKTDAAANGVQFVAPAAQPEPAKPAQTQGELF